MFVVLVLSKVHAVAKNGLVAAYVEGSETLISANAQLGRVAAVRSAGRRPGRRRVEAGQRRARPVSVCARVPGVHPAEPAAPEATVGPRCADRAVGQDASSSRGRVPSLTTAATGMACLRAAQGFLLFLMAFSLRTAASRPTGWACWCSGASSAATSATCWGRAFDRGSRPRRSCSARSSWPARRALRTLGIRPADPGAVLVPGRRRDRTGRLAFQSLMQRTAPGTSRAASSCGTRWCSSWRGWAAPCCRRCSRSRSVAASSCWPSSTWEPVRLPGPFRARRAPRPRVMCQRPFRGSVSPMPADLPPEAPVAEGRPGRGRARPPVRAPDAAADLACDRRSLRAPRRLQGRAPPEDRAYKARGATNQVRTLLENGTPPPGVVASSSGNHGQAVAWAAGLAGHPATIVVPDWIAPPKRAAIEGYGARVVVQPGVHDERNRAAAELAAAEGLVDIPPYDHPVTIAGQGTWVLEALEDGAAGVDTVVVPIGGGGLASGTILGLEAAGANARVYGVEPTGADDTRRSIEAGHRVSVDHPDSVADALLANQPGRITFEIMLGARRGVDGERRRDPRGHAACCGSGPSRWSSRAARPRSPRCWPAACRVDGPLLVMLSGGNVDLDRFRFTSPPASRTPTRSGTRLADVAEDVGRVAPRGARPSDDVRERVRQLDQVARRRSCSGCSAPRRPTRTSSPARRGAPWRRRSRPRSIP